MSNNTRYTVFVNGAEGETRSRKDAAIALAQEAHSAANGKVAVTVQTSAGTEVFSLAKAVTAKAPKTPKGEVRPHAKPYTRTVGDTKVEFPPIAGYELAYDRTRVRAGVYRAGKGDYLVVTVKDDGKIAEKVPASNTIEAREITNELAAKYREAKAAEKAAEQERKAQAKRDREAARAAKAAEKEKVSA